MKQSLSYYATLGVIKLKGIKKNFSKNPIDYIKVRKEDLHNITSNFSKKCTVQHRTILKSEVTEILQKKQSNKLILFIHGGAFISGPSQHHWYSIKHIVKKTNNNEGFINYYIYIKFSNQRECSSQN